ncbi:unnamed protein product, partial [Effrenium voratum]
TSLLEDLVEIRPWAASSRGFSPGLGGMAKTAQVLGPFVPFGQEFLSDPGTYQLFPVERDGIIEEEEFFIANGRACWSRHRQVKQSFEAAHDAPVFSSKVPQIIQALRCSFSQLRPENGEEGDWALLSSEGVAVQGFLARIPRGSLQHAWRLHDGLLLLVTSPEGVQHTLSLIGHPLNFLRCISYVEVSDGLTDVRKDTLSGEGHFQLRWVCDSLPLALAYSP